MNRQFGRLLTLMLLFCLSGAAFGQEVITYENSAQVLPLGQRVYYLEDPTRTLSIQNILTDSVQSRFRKSEHEQLNFGNTESSVWLKFTVQNLSDEQLILEIKKSLIHQIELYKPFPNGRFVRIETGALYPLSTRPIRDNYFLFKLLPPRSQPATFYFRFTSAESLQIPIHLSAPSVLFHEHKVEEILFGLFYGLMAVMLVYNLFLFISVREKAYLLYVLYLCCAILLNDMMITGLGFEYLWPNSPAFNYYVNALTGVLYFFMIFFSSAFLNTKVNTPQLHKGFYIFYAASVLIIYLNLSGDYFISSVLSQFVGLLLSVFLFVVGVDAYKKGVTIARYYLLAWGVLLLSGVTLIMLMNDLIPSNIFTEHATLIGTALEVILLSFALGDRINVLRKEKENAQREQLLVMEQHTNNLERLVSERTREILEQNREIAAQNEELLTHQDHIKLQNEELFERNKQLEEAQGIIEIQHKALKKYSENLEREVEKRAYDLVQTNKELVFQNQQLEQFAFIAAHNLRAPVARIQGLANLLEHTKDQPDSSESKFILEKVVESSRELDGVIYDLARVLEIRKDSLDGFKMVDLEERINRVLSLLRDEIDAADIVIKKDLNVREFFSIPQYLESIVYNLVSNSIKFRRQDGQTELVIKTSLESNTLHLMVKDNGVGFNANQFRDKLFGLYQRFHTHVGGKGIGLHLVKTQVDALNGTIEVSSKPDEGTTFIILLPRQNA